MKHALTGMRRPLQAQGDLINGAVTLSGTLVEQKNAFTSEGAPPPGVVGTDLPRGVSVAGLVTGKAGHRKILTLKKHRESDQE
ncbi:MAG: hypothetical protein ABIN37_14495, partial [Burkholderiaceae bacterium]